MWSLRKFRSIRVIAPALLLAGLLMQTQVLFACDLMEDGPPQSTCCCGDQMDDGCEMGGGCTTQDSSASNCCEIFLGHGSEIQATAAVFPPWSAVLLEAPQPPPESQLNTESAFRKSRSAAANSLIGSSLASGGSHTYFVTGRLRI